jgi:hypothetical protein
MFENPMWTISWSGDSVAPVIAAITSPRRIASAASPMLCVPVEHAVTTHMLWPRMPVSIAIWPDAVSGSMLAMKNGLTNREPFFSQTSMLSSSSCGPPPPHPKITPMSSRLSGPISIPESASACFAAATPMTTLRSVRRAALKSIHLPGSKPSISPATFASYGVTSKRVIGPSPVFPATRFDHTVSTSWPIGLSTPRPVTATRRS